MLLGLVVLPVVLVSGTAVLVDITSSTDAGRLVPGLIATLAGVIVGCVALRVVRAAVDGFSCLAEAAVAFIAAGAGWLIPADFRLDRFQPAPVPVLAVVRQPLSRRGPPQILR